MITVEVKGLETIKKNIHQCLHLSIIGLQNGVDESIKSMESLASEILNNKVKQGMSAPRPSESINENWIYDYTDKPMIKGRIVEGTLGNSSPHAHLVEFGTGGRSDTTVGPTHITPVTTQALSFTLYGTPVVRDYVRGQYPKHYLRDAINQMKPKIPKIIGKSFMENLRIYTY